jgi:nucleoside phosphorylase
MNIKNLIYFAKPEELNYTIGLDKELGFCISQSLFAGRTLYNCKCGELEFTYISGFHQGERFYFDFIHVLFSLCPKTIILAGICASNIAKGLKPGDVVIGESSRSLCGKLSDKNIESLIMDDNEIHSNSNHDLVVQIASKFQSKFNVMSGSYLQSPFVLDIPLDFLFNKISTTDRKLLAIDMESWYYFNASTRMGLNVLPVVKGVSDSGHGKTDDHHKLAIKNSFMVSIEFIREFQVKNELPKQNSRTFSSIDEDSQQERKTPIKEDVNEIEDIQVQAHKRHKKSPKYLVWNQIIELISNVNDKSIIQGVLLTSLTLNKLKKMKNQISNNSYDLLMDQLKD